MGYITNFLIESWMIDHDIPSLGDGHQAMNKVLYTLMFWTPNTGWMTINHVLSFDHGAYRGIYKQPKTMEQTH